MGHGQEESLSGHCDHLLVRRGPTSPRLDLETGSRRVGSTDKVGPKPVRSDTDLFWGMVRRNCCQVLAFFSLFDGGGHLIVSLHGALPIWAEWRSRVAIGHCAATQPLYGAWSRGIVVRSLRSSPCSTGADISSSRPRDGEPTCGIDGQSGP